MGSSANKKRKQPKLKTGKPRPFKSNPAATVHVQRRRKKYNATKEGD